MRNWLYKLLLGKNKNFAFDYYYIHKQGNKGRRLIIPDIHGCINTFIGLLNHLRLTRKDQLFFLGDYIDRGPDSAAVLDIIIELIDEGYNIFPLRGNHEQMLLEHAHFSSSLELKYYLDRNNTNSLLGDNGKIKPKYLNFIEKTVYYFELDKCYIVHAGFNFKSNEPFKDFESMLWIRDYEIDENFLNGKKIIHGHTPLPLNVIVDEIECDSDVIPLDNGCVFYNGEKDFGSLLCFDLDTQEMIIQKNLDFMIYNEEEMKMR